MLFGRIAAIGILALTAGTSLVHAQTADVHHPSDQGAAQAAPAPQPGVMPMGMAGPGGAPGMPSMMGNMMQMMGGMMQMMPMMCGSMMQGASGAPSMGGPMERHGMGPIHAPLRHIEGILAFYKAELAITDAQLSQWSAFADAVRAGAKLLDQAGQAGPQPPDQGTALEQMQRRAAFLSAQLESLKLVQAAAAPLYAALSAGQKKVADELMAEHWARM
jgi:hypothetical protein